MVDCHADKLRPGAILNPNPEASFQFYGGFAFDPIYNCDVSVPNFNFKHRFTAFGEAWFDCKRIKQCTWQIRHNNPYLYEPSSNTWVQMSYDGDNDL